MAIEYYYTIDIGENLASKKYTDAAIKNIMSEAWIKGVHYVISISNHALEVERNVQISNNNEYIYFTAGVHPHNAKDIHYASDLKPIEIIASQHPKCVAIGEIGLDYNRMFSPKENQIQIFKWQLGIAKRIKKPVYLHCRDAFEDFYNILKTQNIPSVIHCFTGNKEEARQLVELGCFFGITGWLFDNRRNKNLIEAIRIIPTHRLMVETDAPFLSINKKRHSLPEDTEAIVQEIARIKKVNEIELGKEIYQTTLTFFGLKI